MKLQYSITMAVYSDEAQFRMPLSIYLTFTSRQIMMPVHCILIHSSTIGILRATRLSVLVSQFSTLSNKMTHSATISGFNSNHTQLNIDFYSSFWIDFYFLVIKSNDLSLLDGVLCSIFMNFSRNVKICWKATSKTELGEFSELNFFLFKSITESLVEQYLLFTHEKLTANATKIYFEKIIRKWLF